MPAGRSTGDRKGREAGVPALRRRVAELSARLEEAESTLSAIRRGEVDAVIVGGPAGDRVFTLEGAEHTYRLFLDDMGDGAVSLTKEGLILYANRRFAEIVGSPLEQVIGSLIFRFLSPSGGEALRGSLAAANSVGIRDEATFETRHGRVPALLSLNALPNSDPPAICMVVTDLTERARIYQELLNAHREVAESERRFRFLVDSSLVGVFIVVGERIVFANVEQQRIFGGVKIPTEIKDLKNVLPQDRERFERLCDEPHVASSGMVETDIRFCTENPGEEKKGPLWAHCRAASIEYRRKKAVLINMVDVTRTKEIEQIAILQEKMASLGQVTAGIAHNIRNPLSGMNMYLSTMKSLLDGASGMDSRTKESTDKIIEMLLQASGKIASVIRQVLDFAKPTPPALTLVQVGGAIREAVELCRVHMNRNGVSIKVSVPEGLPACYAGAGILEQVFINVINNATQALQNHAGDRRIAIDSDAMDGSVVVRIADSGPGVPEKIREKIFEPFYTTRGQGTGIGLAFSRRVMDSMGGRIEVGSSGLGGAEFLIRIPAGDRRKSPRVR